MSGLGEFLQQKVYPYRKIDYYRDDTGYIVWRRGTGDNVELLHIHVYQRGKGHGKLLFHNMLKQLAGQPPYWSVFGFTRVSNQEARNFYQALGFDLVHIPGVYHEGRAILFHAPYQRLVARMG